MTEKQSDWIAQAREERYETLKHLIALYEKLDLAYAGEVPANEDRIEEEIRVAWAEYDNTDLDDAMDVEDGRDRLDGMFHGGIPVYRNRETLKTELDRAPARSETEART